LINYPKLNQLYFKPTELAISTPDCRLHSHWWWITDKIGL